MKILLALDDNPHATDEALRIAREKGATLNALFVMDATWDVFTGHDWLSGCNSRIGFLEYMQDEEQKAAAKAALDYTDKAQGVAGELLTVTGNVVDEILAEAAKGYDLLVMSNPYTRGLEMMRDAVTKVGKATLCDVLLVKPRG